MFLFLYILLINATCFLVINSSEKMLNSFQPTPSIVVEDVDHLQTRLGFQSPPSYHMKIHDNNNVPSTLSLCTTFGIIKPDVDAYVTPLSLCQLPSTPKSPSSPVPPSVESFFFFFIFKAFGFPC